MKKHRSAERNKDGGFAMSAKQPLLIIERIARILQLFNFEKHEWGITEIAQKTGLSKSVTYRLLHSMEEYGFIKQNNATKKYGLGMRFFELGQIVKANMDLRTVAKEVMTELSRKCNQTVILCIIDHLQQVCIEKVDGLSIIRIASEVGARIHLHAGASAKLLLAYLPPEERERCYREFGLPRFTKKTITDREQLETELSQIREQGYALSVEERDINLAALAAPVFDYRGEVVASLTLIGPKWDFGPGQARVYIKEIRAAAGEISERLGYKREK